MGLFAPHTEATMRTKSACFTAFLAVSLSALALAACSGDATAPAADPERVALDRKVQDLKDRYGWMGEYHTDGLEYVYGELSRSDLVDGKQVATISRALAKASGKQVFPISAPLGEGLEPLLDAIVERLGREPEQAAAQEPAGDWSPL